MSIGALQVLPDEVLQVILKNFSPGTLARLRLVCKASNVLCDDESLWEYLVLRDFGPASALCGTSWKQTYFLEV